MGSESKKKRKREEKEEAKKRKKKKESKKKHKKKESKSRKHEKHSKKRSKHEQKTGADDASQGTPEGGVVLRMPVKLLVSLLSHHPHVSRELYLVMRALEDGQGVALDGIPVLDLRKRMAALLEGCGVPSRLEGMSVTTTYYLPQPAQQQREGGDESENPLLRAALSAIDEAIGPLPDVSEAQSCVDGLLCRFPVLEEEVPGLLQRVAAGERVVVSGLEDEALRSGLVRVFEALGLTLGKQGEEEEEGYGLVSGAGRSEQRARVRELILRNGGTVDQDQDHDDDEDEEEAAAKEGAGQEAGTAASSAGPAAEEGEGGGAAVGGKKVVGPAMPDAALLAEAQARAAQMMEEGQGESSDDDDDDMVGPSLGDGRSAVPDHIAYHHLESKARAKGGREEWMTMGPGVPSLANLQPSMKGRQFNQRSERAKQANPGAEKRVLTPGQIREMEADAAKDRGRKTLLQQHQERVAQGKGPKQQEPLASKGWSREEFIEGKKAMDPRSANKLFEAAKELGTRFSRSFR